MGTIHSVSQRGIGELTRQFDRVSRKDEIIGELVYVVLVILSIVAKCISVVYHSSSLKSKNIRKVRVLCGLQLSHTSTLIECVELNLIHI